MRGRHKAWAAPFLQAHPEFVVAKIDASDPFYASHPLYLEIGIGKGDFLLDRYAKAPGHYLGLERDVSIMGMAAKKAVEQGKTDLRLCPEDLDDVYEGLSALRFDVIYLNFSDPWPKKRHEKRRLTYLPRLQKICDLLAPCGELRIKTDNDILYPFTLEQIQGLKGVRMRINDPDYAFDEAGDSMSEYERNFRSLGHPIHRIVLQKED